MNSLIRSFKIDCSNGPAFACVGQPATRMAFSLMPGRRNRRLNSRLKTSSFGDAVRVYVFVHELVRPSSRQAALKSPLVLVDPQLQQRASRPAMPLRERKMEVASPIPPGTKAPNRHGTSRSNCNCSGMATEIDIDKVPPRPRSLWKVAVVG